jgi:hypothetical protein
LSLKKISSKQKDGFGFFVSLHFLSLKFHPPKLKLFPLHNSLLFSSCLEKMVTDYLFGERCLCGVKANY